MATPTSPKTLLSASFHLLGSSASSLSHRRPLTCSAAASSHPRLVPHPPDLLRWVRRSGGFVHPHLQVAGGGGPGGLGLVATGGDIPKGSTLVALPEHLPLRLRWAHGAADEADRPDLPLFQLVQRVPEELWAMRLGLKLLQERDKTGSFWWPYISNLPEAFDIPIFFSGEEIKNLHYAPLVHQVNKRCRFLLDFDKVVRSTLENVSPEHHPFSGQDVNASSLGWAMSAVSSRAFRLHGETLQGGTSAHVPMLLPLIDMCNHSFNPNSLIVQEQNHSKMLVEVVSKTSIEKDSPVTLNYGGLSNDLFLLDYGFVISSNPYDHVELKYDGVLLDAASMAAGVSSPSFSSPTEWQQGILSQLNLHGDGALLKVNLGGPERVDGRLLAALRIFLAENGEAARQCDLNTLKSLSAEAPLGVSAETAALRTVIALCVIALQQFPTKIMEDESILKGDVTDSMKLAVQFRMEKKSMIIDLMGELTRRVRVLSKETHTAQS